MASIEAKTSNQSPRVMKQILQHANWPTGCNFGDPKFWPSGTAHSVERRGRREGVTVANPFEVAGRVSSFPSLNETTPSSLRSLLLHTPPTPTPRWPSRATPTASPFTPGVAGTSTTPRRRPCVRWSAVECAGAARCTVRARTAKRSGAATVPFRCTRRGARQWTERPAQRPWPRRRGDPR